MSKKAPKITKISAKSAQKTEKPAPKMQKHKKSHEEKPLKQVNFFARPFVAFTRYLRDSWRELRLVRWPSRGMTWKMTLAVLIYCAIFIIFVMLLDTLFTFLFNLLINN